MVGCVIYADGVTNRPAPAELTAAFRAEQHSVRERIGQMALSELPTLAAWRGVVRGFGVNPTRYRCAADGQTSQILVTVEGHGAATGVFVHLTDGQAAPSGETVSS